MEYNKIKRYLSILLVILPFVLCCNRNEGMDGEHTMEQFMQRGQIGVYIHGTNILKYDEYEMQIAYNPMRNMLRFQTNDQSIYVHLAFSNASLFKNQEGVNVAVNYKTSMGDKAILAKMTAVKSEDKKRWWWDEELKVGFILWENWDDISN